MNGSDSIPDYEILYRAAGVSLQRAAVLLGVSARQVRYLVVSGKLEQRGGGHHKQILSSSILVRIGLPMTRPERIAEQSGIERNKPEHFGTIQSACREATLSFRDANNSTKAR